jgi:hypothetical protein
MCLTDAKIIHFLFPAKLLPLFFKKNFMVCFAYRALPFDCTAKLMLFSEYTKKKG